MSTWGIEPQVGNADAGTRRPQVRTRWGRQPKGTLEAATMLAGSLDGKQVNMDSDNQYEGNATLSNKRENPIWNNSLLSND